MPIEIPTDYKALMVYTFRISGAFNELLPIVRHNDGVQSELAEAVAGYRDYADYLMEQMMQGTPDTFAQHEDNFALALPPEPVPELSKYLLTLKNLVVGDDSFTSDKDETPEDIHNGMRLLGKAVKQALKDHPEGGFAIVRALREPLAPTLPFFMRNGRPLQSFFNGAKTTDFSL